MKKINEGNFIIIYIAQIWLYLLKAELWSHVCDWENAWNGGYLNRRKTRNLTLMKGIAKGGNMKAASKQKNPIESKGTATKPARVHIPYGFWSLNTPFLNYEAGDRSFLERSALLRKRHSRPSDNMLYYWAHWDGVACGLHSDASVFRQRYRGGKRPPPNQTSWICYIRQVTFLSVESRKDLGCLKAVG